MKWPKNMLFARALSNGAKWYCPDVFTTGIYTPDEFGVEIDGETGEVLEAPQISVVEASEPETQTSTVPSQTSNGKPDIDPARPYSPGQLRDKVRAFAKACKANGHYHDPETGEPLPIKLHPFGERTPQLLAAKMQEALDGEEDVYHKVLDWFFFNATANELKAVEAAAMFRILFNGSQDLSFKLPVLEVARVELAKVYEQLMEEIPF